MKSRKEIKKEATMLVHFIILQLGGGIIDHGNKLLAHIKKEFKGNIPLYISYLIDAHHDNIEECVEKFLRRIFDEEKENKK